MSINRLNGLNLKAAGSQFTMDIGYSAYSLSTCTNHTHSHTYTHNICIEKLLKIPPAFTCNIGTK